MDGAIVMISDLMAALILTVALYITYRMLPIMITVLHHTLGLFVCTTVKSAYKLPINTVLARMSVSDCYECTHTVPLVQHQATSKEGLE